jgi:hypothetical protein
MSTTTVELASHGQQESQSSVHTFGPIADDAIIQAKQKWNDPPINKWRLLATFASFAVVGASDGVYGVSSPCTDTWCRLIISLPGTRPICMHRTKVLSSPLRN